MPFIVEQCTQPECLLWEEGVDCGSLAELVVRGLSGEDVSNAMAGRLPIQPHKNCMDCVLRVMRGGEPGVEEYIRVGPIRVRSERRPREVKLKYGWGD
jgi:hypothetical protein